MRSTAVRVSRAEPGPDPTGRAGWPRLGSRSSYLRVLAGGGGSGTTDFATAHSYDFWRSFRD
ncbi:hypothetical protein ACQP08_31590 [Micromonospora zamorensis]|uniref:hypothetical protein n=1 Tax=Micromonospora zamorensis TaxID=709883 RepID=UPI003D940F3B